MLDVTHIPRGQKAYVQEFNANSLNFGIITSVAVADAIGNLTVTAGDYRVGQAITITGTFTAGSITGYVAGTTYYIGSVASTTSIRITNTYYNAINGVFALTTTAGTATPGAAFTLHEHQWTTWIKPRSISFIHVFALAGGGGGGGGVLGATSTAAGGGGGGSSAEFSMLFPAWALPDRLYISVGQGGFGGSAAATPTVGSTGGATAVSITSDAQANNVLAYVFPGGTGGAGAAAVGGIAGVGGLVTPIAYSLLSGLGFSSWGSAATNVTLVGQAGTAGGTTAAGTALTIPVTGLTVTGGTGGAGVGANATTGAAGGAFTVPAGSVFPAHSGGAAAGTVTGAGFDGASGVRAIPKLQYFYGGTGGGSAGGSNTNPVVGGGTGGYGSFGCGGGGGGGGRTGATSGSNGGRGGPGLVVITAW